MKALALWFIVAMSTAAAAAPTVAPEYPASDAPKVVGVVVPKDDQFAWMTKELQTGIELVNEKLNQDNKLRLTAVPLQSGLDSEATINSLMETITAKNIDVVVAASTADTAKTLRHLDQRWKTPTVVINPVNSAPNDLQGRNENVIDFGIPLQALQEEILARWQNCYARDGLIILYNEQLPWLSEFAEKTARKYSEELPTLLLLPWSDLESPSVQDETIEKVVLTTRGKTDTGVIVAGAPWNNEQWISLLRNKGVYPPIYIGPLVPGPVEIKYLASETNSTIFTASEYWTNPDDSYQNGLMIPAALKLHDVVTVIAHANAQGRIGGSSSHEPWWQSLSSSIEGGIKGSPIMQYGQDDPLWGPSGDLLQIKPGGNVSISSCLHSQ